MFWFSRCFFVRAAWAEDDRPGTVRDGAGFDAAKEPDAVEPDIFVASAVIMGD